MVITDGSYCFYCYSFCVTKILKYILYINVSNFIYYLFFWSIIFFILYIIRPHKNFIDNEENSYSNKFVKIYYFYKNRNTLTSNYIISVSKKKYHKSENQFVIFNWKFNIVIFERKKKLIFANESLKMILYIKLLI
jgi:hypothetical protein